MENVYPKIFNLEEARALMPILKELLASAKADLGERGELLHLYNERLKEEEEVLDNLILENSSSNKPIGKEKYDDYLSQQKKCRNTEIELSRTQQEYVDRADHWVNLILKHGVILRDLSKGLIDFPAQKGSLTYFLCWTPEENDICYWHLTTEGFVNRKNFASLEEYF
jgi:hypothetical protein